MPSSSSIRYEPVSLSASNPSFFSAAACFLVGADILANTFLSAVPAFEPLTPAFACKPIAVDKSVIVIPKEPACEATCFIELPHFSTVVLEDVIVAANLSTKSLVLFASRPSAVM